MNLLLLLLRQTESILLRQIWKERKQEGKGVEVRRVVCKTEYVRVLVRKEPRHRAEPTQDGVRLMLL